MKRALVVLSGGADSATCLGMAMEEDYDEVRAVFVDYGQRHLREAVSSKRVAGHYNVLWGKLKVPIPASRCALVGDNGSVPDGPYEVQAQDGPLATEVPFRNGVFMAQLASLAEDRWPDDETTLVLGVHGDDCYAYPDCRPAFVEAMARAVELGTAGRVRVSAPLQSMGKADIIRKGLALGVPYDLTWSCYKGGRRACGRCATCLQRLQAFKDNGAEDPIDYEVRL